MSATKEDDLSDVVGEVCVWTNKLSASCSDVLASLTRQKERGAASSPDTLRKGCGGVARNMTQLVSCCNRTQKAASGQHAGPVTVMNKQVLSCISLSKQLIGSAKSAMGSATMSQESLETAKKLNIEITETCKQILSCAGLIKAPASGAASPMRPSAVAASVATPPGTPNGSLGPVDPNAPRPEAFAEQVLTVRRDMDGLSLAINGRDAVAFVAKAKAMVTSFSGLKMATVHFKPVRELFTVDQLSGMIVSFVKSAKQYFQAPNDNALHRSFLSNHDQLATVLEQMLACTRTAGQRRSLLRGNSGSPLAAVGSRDGRRSTISSSSVPHDIRAAFNERLMDDSERQKALQQAKEESEKADKAAKAKAKADAEVKAHEEEAAKMALDAPAAAEEAAMAAAEAATMAAFEDAAKADAADYADDSTSLEDMLGVGGAEVVNPTPEADLNAEQSNSQGAQEGTKRNLKVDSEWVVSSKPPENQTPKVIRIGKDAIVAPRKRPSVDLTSSSGSDTLKDSVGLKDGSSEDKASGTDPEKETVTPRKGVDPVLGHVVPVPSIDELKSPRNESTAASLSPSVTSSSSAELAINLLKEAFPDITALLSKNPLELEKAKQRLDDELLLRDALQRNSQATGRGSQQSLQCLQSITKVQVAVYCFLKGVSQSQEGHDLYREQAVWQAEEELLSNLMDALSVSAHHAKDTVPKDFHDRSLVGANNAIVELIDKGMLQPDEFVLKACKVHTVGLIESQMRERLFVQATGMREFAVRLLHSLRIVFSSAMVELHSWVELCASCTALTGAVEGVMQTTLTIAEIMKLKKTNFRDVTYTEQLDVEELVNISIWDGEKAIGQKNGKPKVSSLNELVCHLTSDKDLDSDFMSTFICTYRSFSTPTQLLTKLRERFDVPTRLGNRVNSIRLRVCVTLKYWVQNQFPDFDESLIKEMHSFLNSVEEAGLSAMAEGIRQQLKEKTEARSVSMQTRVNRLPPPLVLPSRKMPLCVYLQLYTPLELARQLTLIDYGIFAAIQPAELMNQAWTSKKLIHRALHVDLFMNRVNAVSNWVGTILVSLKSLADRIKQMQFLVEVAYHLRQLNNFHSLMGLIAGLNTSAVSRLKFTKEGMGKDCLKKLASLEALMHPSGSFKHYRKQLASAKLPAIPYIGVYLTDLVFIEEGNPDEIDGKINFEKRQLTFAPVNLFLKFQAQDYNFPSTEPLHSVLQHLHSLDESQLWSLSQMCEPRGALLKDIDR